MAKLSIARIEYLIENIQAFNPLTRIYATEGYGYESITPARETVINILNNYKFFRKFGHASAKINIQQSNGDNAIIVIKIFCQSPDKTMWTKRIICLETTAAHCHKLGI